MNGLPWAIDASVGVQVQPRTCFVGAIIAVLGVISRFVEISIVFGVHVNATYFVITKGVFKFAIGATSKQFRLFFLFFVIVKPQSHLCIGYGMPRCGVQNGDTHTVVWQLL